jgi:outer membrane receptor for ferrienterochelin and colicins
MVGLVRSIGALVAVALLAAICYGQKLPGAGSAQSGLLEDLPVVEAASLHTQTLQEAPANVTIVTEDEIHRYGYRTLGEALASVRGFYLTDDRTYRYVGVRGFSLPGDYNTRFLVMVNGHAMTENIYGSNNYFGQDFGLDMDLVKRIEVIRGPSSALYGSNGMFATINIITKSPVERELAHASTEVDSFGEKKALVSTSLNLGRGANLLISGSVFNNSGQSLYFPEYDSPETNQGWARGVDGERGYHAFANLVWRNWSFIAVLSSREKNFPTPSWGANFGDRGNKLLDARSFAEAAWTRDIGVSGKLRWRLYYDQYTYRGRYDRFAEDGPAESGLVDNRDESLGNWVGSQVTYRFDLPHSLGALTLGSEVSADIRASQRNYNLKPVYAELLNVNDPDLAYGMFLQHEWQFHRGWTANLGLRFDDSRNHGHFLAPRLTLVYQISPQTVCKLMSGIAFRNPNAFELFYDDRGVSQIPNPLLRPERIRSVEAALERQLGKRLNAVATVYQYWLQDLIEAIPVDDQLVQYRNVSRYRALGTEFELNGHVWKGIEGAASVAWEDLKKNSDTGQWPPNSPRVIGKLRLAVPFDRGRFSISGAVQTMSARRTSADDLVDPVYLTSITVTSSRLHPDFDMQFGIRNLFDQKAWDPASTSQGLDRLARDGRSVFLKLVWHTRR